MTATDVQTFIMAAAELKAGDRIVDAEGVHREVTSVTLRHGTVIISTATGIGVLRDMDPVEVEL